MKKIFQVLILFCFFSVNAQDTIIGEYYDYFGSKLKLNADSTFNYTFGCDMTSSWTNGRYKIKKHTIYLEFIPVYDTLRYDWDGKKLKSDTLVLSMEEKSKIISYKDYSLSQIVSGGQNLMNYPEKLYYKKGKLYKFDKKDRLIKDKHEGCISSEKYDPWYVRKENAKK